MWPAELWDRQAMLHDLSVLFVLMITEWRNKLSYDEAYIVLHLIFHIVGCRWNRNSYRIYRQSHSFFFVISNSYLHFDTGCWNTYRRYIVSSYLAHQLSEKGSLRIKTMQLFSLVVMPYKRLIWTKYVLQMLFMFYLSCCFSLQLNILVFQDNYLEEAYKMRNVLQEFRRHNGENPPTILGLREHIFTGRSVYHCFLSNLC